MRHISKELNNLEIPFPRRECIIGTSQVPFMERSVDELLPTRQSLLGRLKNWEDQESWRDFFNTYWKLIYSVGIKAGLDDSAAQDVVQESIVCVAKAIRDFQYNPRNGSFKGWLLTITRRRVTDHLRKQYARPQFSAEFEADDAATPTLNKLADENLCWETLWNEEWEQNLVAVALANVKSKVKSRQYQLFDCFVLKEWSLEVTKEKLHASLAQIYFAKYKVGRLLRGELRNLHRKWEQQSASGQAQPK
jgi:RNA polymerase sigma factor (sigma-70 family)